MGFVVCLVAVVVRFFPRLFLLFFFFSPRCLGRSLA
jgi:hypothetical protein